MPEIDHEKLADLADTLHELAERKKFRRIDFWTPYPKQMEFMALGLTKRERLLSAGNQQGKSETGAFETSCHLTGLYPAWWPGRKWDRPVRAWCDGESALLVRDAPQKKLMGPPGVADEQGTGFIPREAIVDVSMARGVTDAYDTIQVKHYRTDGTPDGVSTLTFKSYEQGRAKHQSEPIDFDWMDEEAPEDIYSEILTRTNATGGMVFTTFTPLKGMSEVARKFFQPNEDDDGREARGFVQMTIADAQHIPAAERQRIISSYPAHEREARINGVPMLGSGRIFPVTEESIREEALLYIPPHWTRLWSVDFGIDHPFAAVLTLWDKDNDCLHVHHAIKMTGEGQNLPINHAAAMKPIGAGVKVAWPHDGTTRDKGSGEVLSKQYKAQGLLMLDTHATFPDGGYSTEAGILEMYERMTTNRFKVAAHLSNWWEEFRMYHRKDGLIVKEHDDLMSATRVGVMAKRFGNLAALGGKGPDRTRVGQVARDVDFDVFE